MPVPRKTTHQVGTPAKAEKNVVADDVAEMEIDGIPSLNLLDELREALAKDARKEPYSLTVPNRPMVSLVFDPNFDFPTFQAWQKRCEDKKTKETDFYRLSVIVISNTNIGIRFDGHDVDQDGTAMLITTPAIHQWLNVPIGSTAQAIRKLYGSDGHAIQAARMIIEQAGYTMEGDVLEAEDSPLDN